MIIDKILCRLILFGYPVALILCKGNFYSRDLISDRVRFSRTIRLLSRPHSGEGTPHNFFFQPKNTSKFTILKGVIRHNKHSFKHRSNARAKKGVVDRNKGEL